MAAPSIQIEQATVEVWGVFEAVVRLDPAPPGNPFLREMPAEFRIKGQPGTKIRGAAFCDSEDGALWRLRFMPQQAGDYEFTVWHEQAEAKGAFRAEHGKARPPLEASRELPWQFCHRGTRDFFFWNGTTAYWLLGWQDERIIRECIDRFAKHKTNVVRVALNGRTKDGSRWFEPQVKNTKDFRFHLDPWPAARPDSPEDPGLDVTRFNLAFWRKAEAMVRYAGEQGVQAALIFHLDGADKGVDPFGHDGMGGPDEMRYYRYAAARLGAFSNIIWDLTNEWHLFRNAAWVEQMGKLLYEADGGRHMISVHGGADFPFRKSSWCSFAKYQSWDEAGGWDYMQEQRKQQRLAKRPMPQVNDEAGYEDHYPGKWGGGRTAPARVADTRRRLAWEIAMSGCYHTTGERADVPGMGGWITGRGDHSMKLLEQLGWMHDLITSLPRWYEMQPRLSDAVTAGRGWILCGPRCQVAYLPEGGLCSMYIPQAGEYAARWFNPREGTYTPAGEVQGLRYWAMPATPGPGDWVMELRRTL